MAKSLYYYNYNNPNYQYYNQGEGFDIWKLLGHAVGALIVIGFLSCWDIGAFLRVGRIRNEDHQEEDPSLEQNNIVNKDIPIKDKFHNQEYDYVQQFDNYWSMRMKYNEWDNNSHKILNHTFDDLYKMLDKTPKPIENKLFNIKFEDRKTKQIEDIEYKMKGYPNFNHVPEKLIIDKLKNMVDILKHRLHPEAKCFNKTQVEEHKSVDISTQTFNFEIDPIIDDSNFLLGDSEELFNNPYIN